MFTLQNNNITPSSYHTIIKKDNSQPINVFSCISSFLNVINMCSNYIDIA